MKLAPVLLLTLSLAATCAVAGDPDATAYDSNRGKFWLTPDDNGGRGFHLLFSGVIGFGIERQWPTQNPIMSWAYCQVPGAIKEVVYDWQLNRSGVSRNDLRSNAIGCAAGVGLSWGLRQVFGDAAPDSALVTPRAASLGWRF